MNGKALADSIVELINNRELFLSLINYLKNNIQDNSSEVKKLYAFVN